MMKDVESFRCPYIDRSEIWAAADTFRANYWPEGILPVDIESIIERRLQLNIEPEHNLLDQLDIDAYLRRDFTGIVVDHKCYMDERYANRLRFSYAHEIGHYVLHREVYSRFPIDNLAEYKAFITNIPDREYGFMEGQANEFAGRLLVPRAALVEELDKCTNKIEDSLLLNYIRIDPGAALSRISPTLCRPFGVSTQAIERRVEREGLWPPKLPIK